MCSLVLAVLVVGQAPPPVFSSQAGPEAPAAVAPDVFAPPKANSRIVMYTASWCGPCQKWKKECKPSLEAAGWQIETLEKPSPVGSVPHFIIHIGDHKDTKGAIH